MYRAFSSGDRAPVERYLSDDFSFSSPRIVRLVESGDHVIVSHEVSHPDGHKGRNTEVLTIRGDQVCATEVSFGWNVE
jgi:hypothetical protein